MRHQVFGKKLSRDTKARKALLANMAASLVTHGQLTTTLAKAKFAMPYVEKLVTLAKKNKLNSNRWLASTLPQDAFVKLVQQLGPGFEDRHGGYTRIVKLSTRRGDSAQMARLEFLEWERKSPNQKKATVQKKGAAKAGVKVAKTKNKN